MTYYGVCDSNIESHDCEVRPCRIRIGSHRYDPTSWAKKKQTGYYFGKIPMKIKHENNTTENKHQLRERDQLRGY